ncbi:uncharacterized protein LOC131236439 [Magnolia sinica]|uniref:uncharacterized protein LOC131236439 n=1 Tax=Magnolia sinica TaxID=86752 RepID=UPI00265B6072|nr:uncharacterized protein LOC131236439 [Magnolia sinica]
MAMAVGAASPATTLAFFARQSPKTKWALISFSAFSASSSPPSLQPSKKELVLYTKPGCCLCDGLKEKLNAAFSLGGPDSLVEVQLQIRDITTNSEWENRFQYEIPVLARVLSDGTEEILPRLSPRLGVELIQKKIAAALRE